MHQYKTINLLLTFTDKDYSEFEKFINSPFFNERESLVKLYNYLKDVISFRKQDNLSLKIIHKGVFSDMPYNELKMRKRLSSLNKLIEKYFTIINQQLYYSPEKLFLLKEINKRGLTDLFISGINEFKKGNKDEYFSDVACQMDYIRILYEEYRMYKSIHNTKAAIKTLAEIENLTMLIGVFLNLLNTSVSLIRKFREINFKIDDKQIREYIQLNNVFIMKYKHLQLFADFCSILNEDKAEKIFDLSDFVIKNHNKIFYGITDLIFNLLLEYTVYKYNAGEEIDRRTYNKLIESMDKSGFTERSKLIPPMNFISITILFSDSTENDFAGRFVKKYVSKLNVTLRNNIYYSSQAFLSFKNKEYGKAIIQLTKLDTGDFVPHIFTKILLIQSYYELLQLEDALRTSDALKRYLYRKAEIQEITKTATLNFIHYILKLISMRKNMFKKTDNIYKNVILEKILIRKEWLAEKALQIEEEKIKLVQK